MSDSTASSNNSLAEVLAWLAQKPTTARAGQAVGKLEALVSAAALTVRPVRLAYVRNFTVEPIETWLKLDGFRSGLQILPSYSGYDPQVGPELTEQVDGADVVVVALRLEDLSSTLTADFLVTDRAQVTGLASAAVDRVLSIVDAVRAGTRAPVLVHNFVPPTSPAAGIADTQDPDGQLNLVRAANVDLAAAIAERDGVSVLDVGQVFAVAGLRACYDSRGDRMSGAPLSRVALAALSEALVRHIDALRGPLVKCVVVDCDDTLWGGVVGEDGISGIVLDHIGPGRRFRDFQLQLRDLRQRGVALAIASRNEEKDVLDVLRTHPECVLSEDDFAAMRINWDDKADSVAGIADELNVSLAQVAFIDDDPVNCDRISSALPDVRVLAWPSGLADGDRLDDLGWFDSLVITDEDRRRTSMYRAEAGRREARAATTSPEEYLRSLDLVATVGDARPEHYARLAQLTQRTNQFNLTTRRYEVGTIQALADDPDACVLWLDLDDRFGKYGVVGLAIVKVEGHTATIDTFLMSCRVLGRHAECALASVLATRARALGASVLVGEYLASERNQQVADLYDRLGFSRLESAADVQRWQWSLDAGDLARPDWVHIIDIGVGVK